MSGKRQLWNAAAGPRPETALLPETAGLKAEDFEPVCPETAARMEGQRLPGSEWKQVRRRFRRNTVAMTALGALAVLLLFAFLGPVLVPYSYDQTDKTAGNLPYWHYTRQDQERIDEAVRDTQAGAPGAAARERTARKLGIRKKPFGYSDEELKRMEAGEQVFPHILGTDALGRDYLVRVMTGARISLSVGLSAALLVMLIGTVYGAVSGYAGGLVDEIMMRLVDLIYAVPEVLVVLLLVTVLRPVLDDFILRHPGGGFSALILRLGPSLFSILLAFALLYWVGTSRIVRAQVLSLRRRDYVLAARALGASSWWVIRRHLLPNCAGQIVVTTCLQIPSAIFLESFLSFLGLGVAAPMTSLGSLTADALGSLYTAPFRLAAPAVLLSIMILAFQLAGDGLRDALDPRLRR